MPLNWVEHIRARLDVVNRNIALAADRSDRPSEAIQIVAIAKGRPAGAIEAALDLGLDQIGENRVEEALQKKESLLNAAITWHMVGHIQSRKAIQIPQNFSYVHSIDRMKIAERLNRFSMDQGVRPSVLLECNVSGESSKGGWDASDSTAWPTLIPEFGEIVRLPALNVVGLMTMAPWVQDEKVLRSTFQRLRQLREYLTKELVHELPELSMGMTDDYQFAVEEGATMLRLGRALFGSAME